MEGSCAIFTLLLWLVINGLDAIWLYFYVQACINPNPRTAVNRTHSGFQGYEAMMFIFGFVWGSVNLAVSWGYFAWMFGNNRTPARSRCLTASTWIFNIFIAVPVAVFFIIMPAFGGWIVVPLVQNWAWNHRCNTYPMYAVLDGRGFKDARYVPNVAHFYQTSSPQSIFSYDINDGSDTDLWTFQLREFDTDQSLIPLDIYPTLQHLQYDFINDTLTGNCTIPVALGSPITNSTSCMTGTFNPNDWLTFNLTSNVPLNNTSFAVPLTTTLLRTVDKQWSFSDDAPSLILDTVDGLTNTLQQTVLRTAVTKRGDCTQLKVCLSGIDGRAGSLVGAEVMAPLGLMMMRQADYAIECTTPKDDD